MILIAGGPRTGKTTLGHKLATETGLQLRSTDDLIGKLEWSAASEAVSFWFDESPAVIEGVAVGRALRKWFKRSTANLDAEVYYLGTPKVPLVGRQVQMANECAKVWREILPELKARNARIVEL